MIKHNVKANLNFTEPSIHVKSADRSIKEELTTVVNTLTNVELLEGVLVIGTVDIELKTGIYYRNTDNENLNFESWKILPRSDLNIFLLLLSKLDMVATKDEILASGWENKMVSSSSICVSIHNIRKFLKVAGINNQLILKNFSGVGYGIFKTR